MSNYVQNTNFATKDALPSGDSLKIVRGTEINIEFNNIATAVATKADTNSPTLATPTLVNPALGTPASGNLANCTFPTLNQNTTGNAATSTALQNARTIGGVSFNGTANINLPGVNTQGNQNTSGNAATASTVTTITTNQVLAATAGALVGSVGSYAQMSCNQNTALSPGDTKAGSDLLFRATQAGGGRFGSGNFVSTVGVSGATGTWRLMGNISGTFEFNGVITNHSNTVSLWLRIS